jgi:hypothetical protein
MGLFRRRRRDRPPSPSGGQETILDAGDVTITQGMIDAGAQVFPIEAWQHYRHAPEWFADALREARGGGDHHARRREILFAVCAAESYLFEWVLVDVLGRDRARLDRYFWPGRPGGARPKWRDIPVELRRDGLIPQVPTYTSDDDWNRLIDYRDGLVHATASRPSDSDPVPSKDDLDSLPRGWAVRVVQDRILELHSAAGTDPPSWLAAP